MNAQKTHDPLRQCEKERKNPNDPSRFIGKLAVTEEGEVAKIQNYLDTDKVEEEARYDGMYAVTTDRWMMKYKIY